MSYYCHRQACVLGLMVTSLSHRTNRWRHLVCHTYAVRLSGGSNVAKCRFTGPCTASIRAGVLIAVAIHFRCDVQDDSTRTVDARIQRQGKNKNSREDSWTDCHTHAR